MNQGINVKHKANYRKYIQSIMHYHSLNSQCMYVFFISFDLIKCIVFGDNEIKNAFNQIRNDYENSLPPSVLNYFFFSTQSTHSFVAYSILILVLIVRYFTNIYLSLVYIYNKCHKFNGLDGSCVFFV